MAGEVRTLSEGVSLVACSKAAVRSTAPAAAAAGAACAGREGQGALGERECCAVGGRPFVRFWAVVGTGRV